MLTIWATFVQCKFFTFHLNQQFQSLDCCGYSLRAQLWFVVDVLDFQIETWGRFFDIFGLATVLATFFQSFGNFFPQSSGYPVFFSRLYWGYVNIGGKLSKKYFKGFGFDGKLWCHNHTKWRVYIITWLDNLYFLQHYSLILNEISRLPFSAYWFLVC